MAEINISNLGGGGGGTLTLTTTGTSGASTYVAGVLNIPVYQGQLTLTTTGTSGAATLVGDTLNIPQYQGAITLTTTGTSGASTLVGNTLNIPNYLSSSAPAGSTGEVQFNSAGNFAASSNLFWDNAALPGGQRLGVGTSAPSSSVHIVGAGATSGTTSFLVQNNGPTDLLRVDNSGVLTIGASSSFPVASPIGASQITSSSSLTNSNIVLTPKGSGALILGAAPTGTSTTGNARGQYAVDFCINRNAATQVASGNYSFNMGDKTTSSGLSSFSFGDGTTASASLSLAFGRAASAGLFGQRAFSSGRFAADGDAQSFMLTFRNSITGTGITELFLDGSSQTASLPTSRAWNVQITLVATVQTAGTGTLAVGDTYVGTYQVGVKNIGGTASLIGAVQNVITAQSDTNMSTSVVTIDATGAKLRIQFTPPTGGTSSATSVIRVVATAFGTQVGF